MPEDDLLIGDRSDPRNPTLVAMFRYIGLADEGGTGIPKILQAWHGVLGLRPPTIDSGTERYEFSLELRHAHLLSDEDRGWLEGLGHGWTEAEQLALLLARDGGATDNLRLRRLTGQHSADASRTLVGLRDQGFLIMQRDGRQFVYRLATGNAPITADAGRGGALAGRSPKDRGGSMPPPSLQDKPGSLQDNDPSLQGSVLGLRDKAVSPHDPALTMELLEIARPARERLRLSPELRDQTVVALCARAPLSRQELAALLQRSETYVREVAAVLVGTKRLAFLYPQQPNHPQQRYVAGPPAKAALRLKKR